MLETAPGSNALHRSSMVGYKGNANETITVGGCCTTWDVSAWSQTNDSYGADNSTLPYQSLSFVFQRFHDANAQSKYEESKKLRQRIEVESGMYWVCVPVRGYGKVVDFFLKNDIGPNKLYNYSGHSIYVGLIMKLMEEPDEFETSYYMKRYLFEEPRASIGHECLIKGRKIQIALKI